MADAWRGNAAASTMVVASIALVTGCASGGGAQSPASPASPQPTSESPTAEERALEAYEGLWDVIVEQSHTRNPDTAELERYASDQALEFAQQSLEDRTGQGVVARGDTSHSPEIADVDDEEVVIDDCMDSTEWLQEDAETGELIEEEPEEPIHRRIEATVEFDGLAWRVSELLLGQVGSC